MCIHLYASTSMCVYIASKIAPPPSFLTCLYLYVSTCMCIHLYVSTSMCVYIAAKIAPPPSLLMCLYLYVSTPAICVYICMCLHLYVSTSIRVHIPKHGPRAGKKSHLFTGLFWWIYVSFTGLFSWIQVTFCTPLTSLLMDRFPHTVRGRGNGCFSPYCWCLNSSNSFVVYL